jgi:hypothetical protein
LMVGYERLEWIPCYAIHEPTSFVIVILMCVLSYKYVEPSCTNAMRKALPRVHSCWFQPHDWSFSQGCLFTLIEINYDAVNTMLSSLPKIHHQNSTTKLVHF